MAAPLVAVVGTLIGMWIAFDAIETISYAAAVTRGILAAVASTAVGTVLAFAFHVAVRRSRKG